MRYKEKMLLISILISLIQTNLAQQSFTLRLLSYNAWGLSPPGILIPERINAITQHIKEIGYDVILLQEVWNIQDYKIITDALNETYYISGFYQLSGKDCTGGVIGCSGLVILSVYPILETEFIPFRHRGSIVNLAYDGELLVGKGLGKVRFQLSPEISVEVYNTHTISMNYNTYYREKQVKEIVKQLNSSSADIKILGGDLNYDCRNNVNLSSINQLSGEKEVSYSMITDILEDSYISSLKDVVNITKDEIQILRNTTQNAPTNLFRNDEHESEILDYVFHGTSNPNLTVSVLEYQVFQLQDKLVSGYSESKCNYALGDSERIRAACKNTSTAEISLSDHEPIAVTYTITSTKNVP